jgi:hypothetical protein
MARYKNCHSEEADNTICELARKTLADEESLSHVGTVFLSGTFRLESDDRRRTEAEILWSLWGFKRHMRQYFLFSHQVAARGSLRMTGKELFKNLEAHI